MRIESLSDLVFGLALSIGSIALIQHIPQDSSELTSEVGTFAFSFLIIVGVWLAYTRTVSVLPVETPGMQVLNLALLFCVVLEPFLYYVLQVAPSGFLDFSSAAFALDTGSMMALLSGMAYATVRQETKGKAHRLSPDLLTGFKIATAAWAFAGGVFIVSASEVFWVSIPSIGYLRFSIWYVALVAFFASRVAHRMKAKKRET